MEPKEQIPSTLTQTVLFPLSFLQDEVYFTKEEEEALEINELLQKSIWPPIPID